VTKIKFVTVNGEDTIGEPETITCGSIITGTTEGEAPGSFPHCSSGVRNRDSPAVYFKLERASGDIEINLCNSSYDTQASVFREVCDGNFECVGGEDDYVCDGNRSLYTIPDANPDDVYAVIVYGWGNGDYVLAVNCDTNNDALPDTMDVSLEMTQMIREKEEMMHVTQKEDCEESECVCPASAGK